MKLITIKPVNIKYFQKIKSVNNNTSIKRNNLVVLLNQEFQIPFEIKNKGIRVLDIKNSHLVDSDSVIYEYADVSLKKYIGSKTMKNRLYQRMDENLPIIPVASLLKLKRLDHKISNHNLETIFEIEKLQLKHRKKYNIGEGNAITYTKMLENNLVYALIDKKNKFNHVVHDYINKKPEFNKIINILGLFAGDSRLKKDYKINS